MFQATSIPLLDYLQVVACSGDNHDGELIAVALSHMRRITCPHGIILASSPVEDS